MHMGSCRYAALTGRMAQPIASINFIPCVYQPSVSGDVQVQQHPSRVFIVIEIQIDNHDPILCPYNQTGCGCCDIGIGS